ncbi:ChaN family lipoprotein [Aestuariibius sp. 2305UL40-4]|uniref:ChaN family lipoprotein n=1 Tax=Aestuariibius violaceus TaxID=3234132 RepID=UPI00345E3B50
MNGLRAFFVAVWPAIGSAAAADDVADAVEMAREAEIVIIGEYHDNPEHHRIQAEIVAALQPTAVIFEMLSDDQAARIEPDTVREADVLGPLLDWERSGWPDIAYYAPIMAAAPEARIVGTGPHGLNRDVDPPQMAGVPEDAARFGWPGPLPEEQQAAREALQAEAHCGVMPEARLPLMVDLQRQRDVIFAARTLEALEAFGAPVVLITGNGHARNDWGVPFALAQAADARVVAIGQGEGGEAPLGPFNIVLDADAPERSDPCAALLEQAG